MVAKWVETFRDFIIPGVVSDQPLIATEEIFALPKQILLT